MDRQYLNAKTEGGTSRRCHVVDVEDDSMIDKRRKTVEKVEKRQKLQFHGTLMDLMNGNDIAELQHMIGDPDAEFPIFNDKHDSSAMLNFLQDTMTAKSSAKPHSFASKERCRLNDSSRFISSTEIASKVSSFHEESFFDTEPRSLVLHSQPKLTVGTPAHVSHEVLLKKEHIDKLADSNDQGKEEKGRDNKHMRWDNTRTKVLCKFLTEQIQNGAKVDKSFKPTCLKQAARLISKEFGEDVQVSNVKNRLRTLKERWEEINKILKNSSGIHVDYDKGLIEMDEITAMDYVKAHPKADPYINKHIDHFADMMAIFSDDKATGEFQMSSIDALYNKKDSSTNLDESNDDDERASTLREDSYSRGEGTSSSKYKKKSKKRVVDDSDTQIAIATHLESLASALKSSSSLGKIEMKRAIIKEVMKWGQENRLERDKLLSISKSLTSTIEDGEFFLALDDELRGEWLKMSFNI